MIPPKIKEAIEANPELNEQLLGNGLGLDWKKFNRTVFEFIARRINKKVTLCAVETPALITEKLILGKDQLNSQLFEKKLDHEDELATHLGQQKRPFNWVSGKTLHSYWNKGQAKDTKLNVLLVYLEVERSAWEEWKKLQAQSQFKNLSARLSRRSGQQDLIKNYYLGSYYLYYQKTDNSQNLVKAPFIIGLDDRGQVYAETITEGHPYRSNLIEIRDGILYIHCENQLFDEKENHLFNVGNETKPEVLFGVSNTTSVTKKLAIGIRNVLVKQKENFTQETFLETEVPLHNAQKNENEVGIVANHFLKQGVNLIHSQNCCSLEALRETMG
jgi:hypothetical protein